MKRVNCTLTLILTLCMAFSLSAQEGTVKGISGIEYSTIKIGNQTWMAENLNTEKASCEGTVEISFANGSERGKDATFQDGNPHFAYYQNRPELEFGAIYNQSTVLQCDLCPSGYRIATKADWEALANHLGGVEKAGAQLKRSGKSGFNAEMMGRLDRTGSVLEGKVGSWWGMAEDGSAAYTIELKSDGTLTLYEEGNEKWGNYVRCVKE